VRRLQNLEPLLDAKIKYVPPLILDNLAVDLGPWSGYHLLAQHLVFSRPGGRSLKMCERTSKNHDPNVLSFVCDLLRLFKIFIVTKGQSLRKILFVVDLNRCIFRNSSLFLNL